MVPSVAHSLRAQGQLAHREDIDTLIPAVAHTLRAEGFDAGEDGTGRGTPLSPIAFSSKDSGHDATTDLAPTMRSMNFDRSHLNGGGQLAVAVRVAVPDDPEHCFAYDVCFDPNRCDGQDCWLRAYRTANPAPAVAYGVSENQRGELRLTDYARQLTTGGGKPGQGYPAALVPTAFNWQNAGNAGYAFTEDATGPLDTSQTKAIYAPGMAVRRLTPTECARLQGFPDDWLDGHSDSAKYRMLGNAVAVPVATWIGERIARLA